MSSGSNPGLADATYRRLRLAPPAQCLAHAQKAANIGRHIQALEDPHHEPMAIQDRLNFANKVYSFARIVKDTSMAFLDLAGAIAGARRSRSAVWASRPSTQPPRLPRRRMVRATR